MENTRSIIARLGRIGDVAASLFDMRAALVLWKAGI
jgi:hypothetical protein